jgi:hypothetical protein
VGLAMSATACAPIRRRVLLNLKLLHSLTVGRNSSQKGTRVRLLRRVSS